MARKKSQPNQHRKKIINFSPERTPRVNLTSNDPMENLHLSSPSSDSTPTKDFDNAMETTMPTSSNNSRPEKRRALTQEIKEINFAIQTTAIGN
ncbi:hypothetical protein TNCV_3522821 [Trichonephila clavipes]|uniref:Uncharacterized protein n=1 Tax=Trichonephila clavipes TaxID=2585209 RepID=A0A8X6W967_TRICX|nr:hypothetical protein TNCV_3522821 [Trichonephila clavipes]